jgi:hypothetical protein
MIYVRLCRDFRARVVNVRECDSAVVATTEVLEVVHKRKRERYSCEPIVCCLLSGCCGRTES